MIGPNTEVPLFLESIRLSTISDHRILLFQEKAGERLLPVWVSPEYAKPILAWIRLKNEPSINYLPATIYWSIRWLLGTIKSSKPKIDTPLNFSLRLKLQIGNNIEKVVIDEIRDKIFYAKLWLKRSENLSKLYLDVTPAIGLMLAIQHYKPIYVLESVMGRAGARREDIGRPQD